MQKTIAKEHICIDLILQKKGLKKTDLAKRLGVNRQTLYAYLEGNITLENIIKISKALEVEIWELFKPSENELTGFIEFNGQVYRIQSKSDLENLIKIIHK
ncbi:helix-turn-helix transcriptional regulator [uncultured Draconibacterium sp.]|uniref:helix-turn-helix domain-containing protein n=1 Tax=uncultured Draconibacterium sp. TaxID=1573823 RepID=UPI0032178637